MRPVFKYIYLIIFSVLISGIGILTFINVGRTPSELLIKFEKRNPTKKPVWKWDAKKMDNYFPQLDAYINDNFALRTKLIENYSTILYPLKVAVNSDRAVIGKNGFLFLGNNFNRVLDQTTGKRLLTNDELSKIKNYFGKRKTFLDSLGIHFYLTIVPNKEIVYQEYLPYYIKASENKFLTQLKEPYWGIDVIGLEKAIIESKINWGDSLYYKTDSHWSEIGAYVAYIELIKYLSARFNKIRPIILTKENFHIQEYYADHDLTNLLYLRKKIKDFYIPFDMPDDCKQSLQKIDDKGIESTVPSSSIVSTFEHCIIINKNKPYTLLLFKDSFSYKLSTYLNNTFGKIIYCYYRDFNFDQFKELVDTHKPDLVIYESVQRDIPFYAALNNYSATPVIQTNNSKWKSFKKFTGKELAESVRYTYQIENITVNQNNLSFDAVDNDPQFLLPSVELDQQVLLKIKINLSSPDATIAQIYYLTDGKQHNGKQCITSNVIDGNSTLEFVVSEKKINGTQLRFDPGNISGKYTVSSVEYFIAN